MSPPPAGRGGALSLAAGGVAVLLALLTFRSRAFTCDDAYIAFRYVAHAGMGLGWTWNPPPFAPVEGYTSPLWVALLTALDALGVAPEAGAMALGLGSVLILVGLVCGVAAHLDVSPALGRLRPALVGLVGVTVAIDPSLATWAGSGLETGLFVLLFVGWALGTARGAPAWLVALQAALCALTRPDGLLLAAATGALVALRAARARSLRPLLSLWPLLLVGAHLLARFSTYGAWLPNTFYAKVGPWWPDAGLAHLAWFLLESGWWVWALAAVVALPRLRGIGVGPLLAGGTVAAYVAYYALKVGGDHFGFRIWTPLVPLLALSLPWLVDRVRPGPAGLAAGVVVLALGRLLAGPHAALQATRTHMGEPGLLTESLADAVAAPVRPLAAAWDALQGRLVPRMIGVRRQQHVVFAAVQRHLHPPPGAFAGPSLADGGWVAVQAAGASAPDPNVSPASVLAGLDVPVHEVPTVGVPGFVLPGVVVVDTLGLNDAAVARNGGWKTPRVMAHERTPPDGYVECLRPNVFPALIVRSAQGEVLDVRGYGARYVASVAADADALPLPPGWDGPSDAVVTAGLRVVTRDPPLTRDDIAACLARYGG